MKVAMVAHKANQFFQDCWTAMEKGLRRHGDTLIPWLNKEPAPADVVVVWGLRRAVPPLKEGKKVLMLERGYLGDRIKTYTSFGWGGLNGRGTLDIPNDGGARLNRLFPDLLQPWAPLPKGYALIIGQVRLDAAVMHVDISTWYQAAIEAYQKKNRIVLFRPHPQDDKRRAPRSIPSTRGTLEDDLRSAGLVVSFNSNVGVLSLVAGKPTLVCDEGGMAYPLCKGILGDWNMAEPEGRLQWAQRLVWRQFTLEEMAYGLAWEIAKKSL